MKIFSSGSQNTSHVKTCLQHVGVILVKLKTLLFQYFLSGCLQCEYCWYTICPLTCPTNKKSIFISYKPAACNTQYMILLPKTLSKQHILLILRFLW